MDGLIITPQSTSIAPALLRAAAQANIPVVVTDRYPGYDPGQESNADYVAFLGPNDEQAGRGIAEALIAAVGPSSWLWAVFQATRWQKVAKRVWKRP